MKRFCGCSTPVSCCACKFESDLAWHGLCAYLDSADAAQKN